MNRARSLVALIVVAAVLVFWLAGHGPPQLEHDGMAGAAAGLCLMLVALLGHLAIPKPEAQHRAVVNESAPSYVGPPPGPPLDRRARASPSALQRFRN